MVDRRMPRNGAELPDTYRSQRTYDLKKDRRLAFAVQAIFGLVALFALGSALLWSLPIQSSLTPVLAIIVTLVACLTYMALHEGTHGVVLYALTRVKPTYTLRFPFLTTGNHAFLTRRSAVIVALAPAVVWGVVLLLAWAVLPEDYRLTAYVLLALNLAGSAGDFVEVYLVSKQPRDALVQDDGHKLHIFVPHDSPRFSAILSGA
jgi:hypothetical protein